MSLPTPDQHQIAEVYDRSASPSHANVDGLLIKSGRRTQGAEINELQQYLHRRIDGIGNAIFADGDVMDGGEPARISNVENKNLRIQKGKIFLKGKVFEFDTVELNIPTDEQVSVGVRYNVSYMDHTQDLGLLNPAATTPGYGEPGAIRVKSTIAWGWKAVSGLTDEGPGEFFPVYSVDNGVVITENSSPAAELVYSALRRYDFDGNGSYVSKGLRVQYVSEDEDSYQFQVDAGAAHILGDIIERHSDQRITYTKDPDSLTSENEFHLFTPDEAGRMNIVLSRPPLASITEIVGTREATVTVIRGVTTGGSDVINEDISSVVAILEVKKGGTTYTATTDYVLSGDEISWAPGGTEPAGGESYTVKFRYIATANTEEEIAETVEEIHAEYIVVSGYVAGQSVLVTYDYNLPRIDLIVYKHDGSIARIKGTPALQNPGMPTGGPNEIAIATVEYDWFNAPRIRNVAVRAVHMSDLEDMRASIFTLFRLCGEERLRNNANAVDPNAKLGVFVDSFKDDTQRDGGTEQTAAIVDGFLMLPMDADGAEPDGELNQTDVTLPFTPVVAIAQESATQCSLINPYQVFAPPDGKLTLKPASDSWTLFVSQYRSRLTALIVRSGLVTRLDATDARRERRQQQLLGQSGGTEIVTQDDVNDELTETLSRGVAVRQRTIAITLKGFQPEEKIAEARFDGVSIASLINLPADDDGNITANFVIPANVPVGTKLFFVQGEFGTYAETTYRAGFRVLPDPPPTRHRDPLAQSFTPDEDMQIVGLDVKFCAKGPTLAPVIVQLREMINGYPGTKALAESEISVDDMNILNADTATATLSSRCYVKSNKASVNFDTGSNVLIGYNHGNYRYRGLLKFTLPGDLAGATIFSARLSMRKNNGDAMSIKAHRLTEAFTASQATWNIRQTGVPWTDLGGTFATESGDGTVAIPAGNRKMISLDVKNIVEQWAEGVANHGIILRSAQEDSPGTVKSVNLDWNTAAPVLEIVYKPGEESEVLGEGWTRTLFPLPTFVRGGVEYCMTLLTTDPGHSVSFARLGDVKETVNNNGESGLVTQQPYAAGVMFDSSNNTTWNPRQKDDLTFRVLRASYTSTTLTADLGDVAAVDVSDFVVRGLLGRPTGATRITFDVAPPSGAPVVNLENQQTLPLPSFVTGTFNVKAKLTGTEKLSPILYANTSCILGSIGEDGTYVTRNTQADETFDATVIFKAFLPAGAAVAVRVSNATYASGARVVVDGVHQFTWSAMTLDSSKASDEGFVEQIWKLTGVKGVTLLNLAQVKLELEGGPAARLLVKDFQFFTQ